MSLLDGAQKISDLIKRCKKLGMDKIAITNHGNMINMPKFILEAEKEGIQIIPGCELYVTWDYPHTVKDKDMYQSYHMVALAKNLNGYKNLMNLCSISNVFGKYNKPRVDKELIERYKEDIIFTTACVHGVLGGRILDEKITEEQVDDTARWLKEVLDGQIYFELQKHSDFSKQDIVNEQVIRLARKYDLPLIAAADSHYAKPEDYEAWLIMMGLSMGGMKIGGVNDLYIKSAQEMKDLFVDLPEVIENTVIVADQCEKIVFDTSYKFPVFNTGDLTEDEYLEIEATRGLDLRIAENNLNSQRALYEERLRYELGVIKTMGFSGYIIIVADFVNEAKRRGIPTGPGRGSVSGCLLAWALRITEVNSIKYGLLLERFLNPDRISMCDIDIDFADDKRKEIIDYVSKKYGKDKVSYICTTGTMAAKGAIRDVCRMLEIEYKEADEFSKKVPEGKRGKNVYLKTITDPKHEDYSVEFMATANSKPYFQKALGLALKLEGMTRSVGTHAAGVVISDNNPITDYLPLMLDKEDNVVSQYDKNVVEDIGLIKFDFLGLATLRTLNLTKQYVERNYGVSIDLDKIPLDDKKTYDLICSGNLAGLFQLGGSSGFLDLVIAIQPRSIEEIADITGLYRPGPLDNGFDKAYIKSKNSKEINYIIQVNDLIIQKRINELLEPTKGVIIYQEQVMKLAQVMAGYTLAQADLLRRAMGKKKPEEMAKQEKRFVEGCVSKGLKKEEGKKAFNALAKFAEYGFPKAHAIAYSLISYQTAYLKAHYPIEFMAASLSEVSDKQDKTISFLHDCKQNGIKVLPPDINKSILNYTSIKDAIVFGLGAVKNLGDIAVGYIIKEREKNGKFKNIINFCNRVNLQKVNTAKIKTLIKVGCFDE